MPLVKPVTVNGEAAPLAVKPPGLDVTTYPVIGLPPVAGAENDTTACALPPAAATDVGALGIVDGVTELDDPDVGPVPAAFLA